MGDVFVVTIVLFTNVKALLGHEGLSIFYWWINILTMLDFKLEWEGLRDDENPSKNVQLARENCSILSHQSWELDFCAWRYKNGTMSSQFLHMSQVKQIC